MCSVLLSSDPPDRADMMESGGGELLPGPALPVASKPGDGRGGWRAALFIVAMGFFERIGFVGVSANLIMYLTGPLGMSTAAAAAGVNAWSGTMNACPRLPLVGALVADSRLGRYRAVLAACVLYLLSLGMLTASSMMPTASLPPSASPARLTVFYVALYLLALAQGFYGPCGEAFGADQFKPSDSGEPNAPAFRSSYFNWFHFSMSWGYAIATAGLSYVQDNAGWTVGFGACWTALALCLAVFLLGTRTYRAKQRPVDGGTFAETVGTLGARVFRPKDNTPTDERLLLPPQPEQGGLIAKLLPIWLTSLVFTAIYSQVSTLFTKQASTLDRHLSTETGLVVPPAPRSSA